MLKLVSGPENRHNALMLLPALILALQLPPGDTATALSRPADPMVAAVDDGAPAPPEQAVPAEVSGLPAEKIRSAYYPSSIYGELVTGRDLILNRHYEEARGRFEAYSRAHPDELAGPVGACIALTSEYLETRSDDILAELRGAVKEAKSRFDKPGPEGNRRAGWHFLRAVAYGNEALLEFWDDNHFAAYRRAQSALSELDAAKNVAPEFADPDLGFGLYEYVLSDKLGKILFFLPDNRKKGVKKLERAAADGQFAGPIAEISLMWIYRKEGRPDDAERTGDAIEKRYPGNILTMMLRAQTQADQGRHEEAVRIYTRMIAAAPDFVKSYFYRGQEFFEMNDLVNAQADLDRYLERSPVDRKRMSEAYFMLGSISEQTGDGQSAAHHYRMALQTNPKNDRAKKALNR